MVTNGKDRKYCRWRWPPCFRWTALIYNRGYPSKMDLTSKNMGAETRKYRKSIAYPPSRRNRSKSTISLNCIKNAPQKGSLKAPATDMVSQAFWDYTYASISKTRIPSFVRTAKKRPLGASAILVLLLSLYTGSMCLSVKLIRHMVRRSFSFV